MDPQNYLIKSDFQDVHGQVYAFAVDPGAYDYFLFAYPTEHLSPPFPPVRSSFPRTEQRIVRIEAGEVVYGGEIWLDKCIEPKVSIRNRWERDEAVVESQFPLLPVHEVQVRLFKSTTWPR